MHFEMGGEIDQHNIATNDSKDHLRLERRTAASVGVSEDRMLHLPRAYQVE